MEISHFKTSGQESPTHICVVAQMCRMYNMKWRLLVMQWPFAKSLPALSWHPWERGDFQVAWQMVNMGQTKTERGFGRQDVMWRKGGKMTWTPEGVRSFWCYCVTAKRGNKSFLIGCWGSGEALGPQTMPGLTARAPAIIAYPLWLEKYE